MKAKELMIGDWVTFVNGKGERIADSQIDINSLYTAINAPNILQFQPIPLTAEILEKNGFIKYNDHRVLYVHINEYNGYALRLNTDDYGWHLTDNRFIRVDSVHELQHLLRFLNLPIEIKL